MEPTIMLARLAAAVRDIARLLSVYMGGEFPKYADGEPSRVAVVLGAQVLSGGRPSSTLEARARHAGRMYADGRLDLLIPTGGLGQHPPSEAEVMARILKQEGVPERAIVLEDEARSTWDSAWLVSEMARRLGVGKVLVVTDPLHCVRTVGAFGEAGLAALAEPVYSSPMWRKPWSRRGQFVRETGALVWYRIKHGVGSRSRR